MSLLLSRDGATTIAKDKDTGSSIKDVEDDGRGGAMGSRGYKGKKKQRRWILD